MSRLVPRRRLQFLLALLALGCLIAVAGPARASAVRSPQLIDLGTLGGESSAASAINASGAVTGWSDTAAGPVEFLWTRRNGMIDLGNLGGNDTFATAIIDRGQAGDDRGRGTDSHRQGAAHNPVARRSPAAHDVSTAHKPRDVVKSSSISPR